MNIWTKLFKKLFLDRLTVQGCIDAYERWGQTVAINDGHIVAVK